MGKYVVGKKKLFAHCCGLLSLLSRLKKRRLEKNIHVQQGTPASMYAIIIFANSECTHYSSFFKLFRLLCAYRFFFVLFFLPERSCLIRPLLLLMSTGRKSLNQDISGSGFPLAAQSMVAVRVRSTTFSCGPMSMVGKP